MRKNKKYIGISSLLILLVLFFSGCSKDDVEKVDLISGLWTQEKVTEDGQEMSLPDFQKSLSLLIEANGVYRTYAKDALVAKEHFGAWSVTDDTWLEMTVDMWHFNANPVSLPSANQWIRNHLLTRFTILSLTNDRLEIRLKTFVGEKKYSALFIEEVRPVITNANYDNIANEYITLKTYIYTFKKVQ
jgi:hypothetical protein